MVEVTTAFATLLVEAVFSTKLATASGATPSLADLRRTFGPPYSNRDPNTARAIHAHFLAVNGIKHCTCDCFRPACDGEAVVELALVCKGTLLVLPTCLHSRGDRVKQL